MAPSPNLTTLQFVSLFPTDPLGFPTQLPLLPPTRFHQMALACAFDVASHMFDEMPPLGQTPLSSAHAQSWESWEPSEQAGDPPQPCAHSELGHRFVLGEMLSLLAFWVAFSHFFFLLSRWQDIIARFGRQEVMPVEFFTDFVRVAQDEGRHFTLLAARLQELGSYYGAFPAHDGLWDSAIATSKSLLARLAVEHCVHEGRGLDVLPTTISRFRNGGDDRTAELLETVVYPEEITHCAAGIKWFKYLCLRTRNLNSIPEMTAGEKEPLEDKQAIDENRAVMSSCQPSEDLAAFESNEDEAVIQTFQATARAYFRGPLKPPFNEAARKAAGFGTQWYEPLSFKAVGLK